MKLLLAIEDGIHPFWDRNSYYFILTDSETKSATSISFTRNYEEQNNNWAHVSYEYFIREDGIYTRAFSCGSGYGKAPVGGEFLFLSASHYDKVIVVPNEEKREAERNYQGSLQDNSDFY